MDFISSIMACLQLSLCSASENDLGSSALMAWSSAMSGSRRTRLFIFKFSLCLYCSPIL